MSRNHLLKHFYLPLGGLLHLAVAWYYRLARGVSIIADPNRSTWDWFWQTAPMDLLLARPFETIWNFHAQPPLFNLLGLALAALFPENYLQALHTLYIVLGAAIVVMLGFVLFVLTRSRLVAAAGTFFLAVYPALILFEAYILYTLLAVFLVVLCIFWVALYHERPRSLYLYLSVLSLNVLILTRSFFHPIILIPGLIFLFLIAKENGRRFLLHAVVISLLLTGVWVTKNAVKFSFWGTSSWSGINLYKILEHGYSQDELNELGRQGVLDPEVVEVGAFNEPDEYVSYGYDETSPIPVLARNDYNNVNMLALSETYRKNALALLTRDPLRYLKTIYRAYTDIYVTPSSRFIHVISNAEKMGLHVKIFRSIWTAQVCLRKGEGAPCISLMALFIPVPMLISLGMLAADGGSKPRRWLETLRQRPVEYYLLFFIVYGLVIGNVLEFTENDRFKFLTELPFIVFTIGVIYRLVSRLRYRTGVDPG